MCCVGWGLWGAGLECLASLVAGHDYGQKESEPRVCWEVEGVLCPSIGKAPTSPLHPTHAQAASRPHSKTRTCWGHTHSQTGWQKRPHSWSCWYILSHPQAQGSHTPLLKAILSLVTAWPSDVPRSTLQRGSGGFRAYGLRRAVIGSWNYPFQSLADTPAI